MSISIDGPQVGDIVQVKEEFTNLFRGLASGGLVIEITHRSEYGRPLDNSVTFHDVRRGAGREGWVSIHRSKVEVVSKAAR
jgi:hypothetical protein